MKRVFIILFLAAVMYPVCAQTSEVFTTSDGAIRGYDAVAYFTESKPVKGMKDYSYTWNGAVWLFANVKNMEAFKASPEKYAPQYGGYCAYGTADGHKATTQPDAWTIVDNKLYLNYNKDVMSKWRPNQKEFILKADANWPTVKKQK